MERFLARRAKDPFFVFDLDAGMGQRRIVRRLEGLKLVGRALRAPVAAQKNAVKVDAHLMHLPGGGNEQRAYDIVAAITSDLPEWNLRAGKNDGL